MPKHAMHRILLCSPQKKKDKKRKKRKKNNQKTKNQPKNKTKNTPQDKKFFVNQILFVNSAK